MLKKKYIYIYIKEKEKDIHTKVPNTKKRYLKLICEQINFLRLGVCLVFIRSSINYSYPINLANKGQNKISILKRCFCTLEKNKLVGNKEIYHFYFR